MTRLVITTVPGKLDSDLSLNKKKLILDPQLVKRNRRTFIALLGFILLYMIFRASKNLANGGMWTGCRGIFGMHRNISNLSISSDKLYQLPSGDKIPAVALGMVKMINPRRPL